MSEIVLKPLNALIVSEVEEGSAADRAGLRSGDLLREINSKPILDILDYRFHAAESRLRLTVERDGQVLRPLVRKAADEDAGLAFEFDLGDKIHTCKNKCVFCFIHQQPKKMRKSLYLMDDDFRLSFMHGNYVTLTNLSDAEWARILEQRLSPLYVSVHSTDPDLRAVLLGRRVPTPVLPQIRELADNGIDVHAQIVLCPGLNDGDHLDRTLDELAMEHRGVTGKRAGVPSVAIVPVGMTRFRERLPSLSHVERDYAREMIVRVARRGRDFERQLGTRFAWLADEWYFIAGQSYPGREHYEDFPQLEDGIGTVRLFLEDARAVSRRLPPRVEAPVRATLVTAEMPAPTIQRFADRLNQIEGVEVNVCVVTNEFFGGDIHIAGLLTAQDILSQLGRFQERHGTVYIPQICLRDGLVFLDDVTIEEAREQSGLDVRVVGNRPRDLAEALGLLAPGRREYPASRHWIVEAAEAE
jgi:putative radical SAM enzyme (TIGR03279 family)